VGPKSISVAFSGGWDSTLCALVARRDFPVHPITLCYANYGQSFYEVEVAAAKSIARRLGCVFSEIEIPALSEKDGIFHRRNSSILYEILRRGADVIYLGSRNPTPFDSYGDSNWFWGKAFAYAHDVDVRMPCTGLPKTFIERCVSTRVPSSMIYSTEKDQ